jgi:hypothetical protein
MGTAGRLQRCFPGTAVSLPQSTFGDDGCQAALVQAISKMSYQEVAEMMPKVTKEGEEHIEERETTNPAMITDFLATTLSSMGKAVQTSQIGKNTREEILWRDAKKPWRRSPVWLLLRVTLQVVLSRCAPERTIYKEFMVFFMSQVLETAQGHDLPSDILHCMMAKISRRLLKLDRALTYPWLQMVEGTLSSTRSCMANRWEEVMRRSDPGLDMGPLTVLRFDEDACASYLELDDFIRKISSRQTIVRTGNFNPPWCVVRYGETSLPRLDSTSSHIESTLFSLLEFENWVACSLDLWLGSHATSEETYEHLCITIRAYHELALMHYSEDPESISTMLLTILELWVACDKLACQWHHLLSDYDPGVPRELLQSLVLPLKAQMERLGRVEAYVQARRDRAAPNRPHIFSSFGTADSFAVRYFDQSRDLQDLHRRIEDDARREREEKRMQFQRLKAEYDRLMAMHSDGECTYRERIDYMTGYVDRAHDGRCAKCRYLSSASALSIDVHEWPLPENTERARSVVFELQVPRIYGDWRSATTYVIIDVLRSGYDISRGMGYEWTLQEYLPSFFREHARRLILVSTTKPNRGTHRRAKAIGTATELDVLVRCGMTYSFYDCVSSCFASAPHATDEIPLSCTYQLSEASLRSFLFRPPHRPNGLPPNEVIAQQASCPDHLSLAEFRALAVLPLGYGIQWSNILKELYAPTIDFKNLDTVLVLLQISCQAGPPLENDVCRAGHWQLQDEVFAERFLQGLSLAVDRIEDNWESCRALGCFISLAARVLTLAPTSASSPCLAFLERCRAVALRWTHLLQDKTAGLEDDGQRMEFLVRTFEAALACASTFDVDDRHLPGLFAIPSVAGVMLECSVVIQAAAHSALQSHDVVLRNSVQRWRSLMYRAHRTLHREIIQGQNPCLDIAIEKSWPAYTGGGVWRPLSSAADHWLVTTSDQGEGSLAVYFNILTAELLANGLPLSRLPAEFEQHPSCETLFGRTMVEVMPTDVPGMQLSSVKLHHGYTVFFGMGDGKELLLTARKNGQTQDLIPSRVFRVLPDSFVWDFVHWYDRQSGVIEFRPRRTPWVCSPSHWRMERAGASWVLKRGDQLLMSPTSTSAKRLSQLLDPLEGQGHIHVVLNTVLGEVDADMPRLQLGFVLRAGSDQLYSRQFRGMYVDPLQGIGALVGLKSKLVLRDPQNRRKVLLPDGPPAWVSSQGHIQVSIPHGTSSRVHPYDVDALLGRVVDNGDLQSKLILCYLLALTSYCLPDKLTGKTGTEESLSVLKSAAVRSFKWLSQENLDKLESIAKLSPGRSYYPEHERVMESISWDGNLSFLSQHGDFYTSVASILDHASSTKFFYPGLYIEPRSLEHVDRQLGKRHSIRSAVFHVSGFGAEHHTSAHDVTYEGRDRLPPSLRSTRAFEVSSMIYERRQTLHREISSSLADDMWELLIGTEGVLGANVLSKADIGYDARWLGEAAPLLREYWCSLHHTLGGAGANRFQAMLCLATLAYAGSSDPRVIQTLASFFNLPVGQLSAPDASTFELAEGRNVEVSRLTTLISNRTLPFWSCPESKLTCRLGESERESDHRRHVTFKKNQARAVESFVSSIWGQWVRQAPQAPTSTDLETYIAVPEAMDDIRKEWAEWYQNLQFYKYLGEITTALQQYPVKSIEPPRRQTETAPPPPAREVRPFIDEQDLFQRPPPALPELQETLSIRLLEEKGDRMAPLVKRLAERASEEHEHDYVRSLQTSLSSLRSRKAPPSISRCEKSLGEALSENLRQCRVLVNTTYQSLQAALGLTGESYTASTDPDNSAGHLVRRFMAPRVSRTFLLRQLGRKHWGRHSPEWKKAIVAYGLMLTQLQRAERILNASGNEADLLKELRNLGHTNWDALHYPEFLLLEVEQGITIRDAQGEIALQMIGPPANANAVIQFNMGEGKSTTVVPICVVQLADGTKLVRAIVGKPQANELFRTLVSKLGGLLDRQIYHMPFSRSLRLTESDARAIDMLCKECMENGGVMLVQPEHLLSFQLMGIECQISGLEKIGGILLDTQDFFDSNSRDVADEADENLTKFELVYTMGTQRPLELSPQRWLLIQRILDICRRVVPEVREQLHESIEIIYGGEGCFSRTRILREDARDLLQSRIAEEICATGLPGFPIARQPEQLRKSVLAYISRADLSVHQINEVHNSGFFTDATKGPLFLLRGLIAEGILGFALGQKRWRVNYGLSSNRRPKTRLAVPYRAKDNPTPSSEFSQPDVVIVLTCLSYYYGGLSDADLFLAFDHLVKSDKADVEYDDWVEDAPTLPRSFRRLVGVNMKDHSRMLNDVFPHMRSAKSVVDYFLAHIVFPKEMKEFPQKLSASGWDIGKRKTHPTTGFSGTKDSHPLLPLAVTQLDLEEQRHTDALVLEYLLQPENSVEYVLRAEGGSSDAETLLNLVTSMEPPVQVILDVGAQILELTNIEVAQTWLQMEQKMEAVVFFNDDDELCVIDRSGRVEAFRTSPYADQLGVCLIFLDEAHTRGTDLKLPKHYRAAVTVGANLTKDRLVQGRLISSAKAVAGTNAPQLV